MIDRLLKRPQLDHPRNTEAFSSNQEIEKWHKFQL